jgi:hypothetical protein
MSKGQIHIDNYESFYLDYLEGNLDDSLRQDLLAFLDMHPNLQVDFEDITLQQVELGLSKADKNSLKVWTPDLALANENVELFLVAQAEGLLAKKQEANLQSFIVKNHDFKSDQRLYKFSHLKSNPKEIYTNKAKLKQKEAIILWPYILSAVAACAVLFIYLFPSQPNINQWQEAVRSGMHNSKLKIDHSADKSTPFVQLAKNTSKNINQNILSTSPVHYDVLAELTRRPLTSLEDTKALDKISVKSISKRSENSTKSPSISDNQDYALAMKNPVAPITRKLSEVMKTHVDYQKGTSQNAEREGFFLKIGNFEIYRNRKLLNKN